MNTEQRRVIEVVAGPSQEDDVRRGMEVSVYFAPQPVNDASTAEKDGFQVLVVLDSHRFPKASKDIKKILETNLTKQIFTFRVRSSDDDGVILEAMKQSFLQLNTDLESLMGYGISASQISASVALIRKQDSKVYLGHIGNYSTKIVLGVQNPSSWTWIGETLAGEQSSESIAEDVPKPQAPLTRSKAFMENSVFKVLRIDTNVHRCLILGNTGLWDVHSSQEATNIALVAVTTNNRRARSAAADRIVRDPPRIMLYPSNRMLRRVQPTHKNATAITIIFKAP